MLFDTPRTYGFQKAHRASISVAPDAIGGKDSAHKFAALYGAEQ